MKMTKKTTRQPKRIKAWINEYDWGLGTPRESIREARNASEFRVGTCRVAVRVVELRRGEVIVDVEALVEAFMRVGPSCWPADEAALRAALKKVGVR